MTESNQADATLSGSDWIKSTAWDFPEVKELNDLFEMLGVLDSNDSEKKDALGRFLKLPAAIPMPDSLKKSINEYMGKTLPNPQFIARMRWCAEVCWRFFPEEQKRYEELYKEVKENDIQFFDDLMFDSQMFIIDLETREIPKQNFPMSQFNRDIYSASKLLEE